VLCAVETSGKGSPTLLGVDWLTACVACVGGRVCAGARVCVCGTGNDLGDVPEFNRASPLEELALNGTMAYTESRSTSVWLTSSST